MLIGCLVIQLGRVYCIQVRGRQRRWAVLVPIIDPGYYRYRPVLQRLLYKMMFLVGILARLTEVFAQEHVLNWRRVGSGRL